MGLRLTLKPNERIIVNGCVIRNTDRRQLLIIENHADVVREAELLDDKEARTPVKEVFYFIQSALLEPKIRDRLVPLIQEKLGKLVPVFHDDIAIHLFEAANNVSCGNYYQAMRALRPVMDYEAQLYAMMDGRDKKVTAAE